MTLELGAPSRPPARIQLAGRLVRLSPVTADDAESVDRFAKIARDRAPYNPQIAEVGPFADWSIATFLIRGLRGEAPRGLLRASEPNFRDRHFSVQLVTTHSAAKAPIGEAVMIFLRYVFAVWDFRKVYAYGSRFALDQLPQRLARSFECEAVLREQYTHNGVPVDERVYAAFRHRFEAQAGGATDAGLKSVAGERP